ncbi:MAG: EamA family transporter [Chloroflexota bacterium]
MIAVLGGLIAALAWGLATVAAARASRVIGAWAATGWVVFVGLMVTIPLLLLETPADEVEVADIAWLVLAGLGYLVGLVFGYAALAGGKIPVTAPIISTEGAIAAMLAVLGGEPAAPPLLLLLGLVTAGIFVVALRPGGGLDALAGNGARYVGFALIAALVFGVGLYAAGRASSSVPASWVVASGRVAGVMLLTLPLLLTRRLRFERAMLPYLIFAGVAEVIGVYAFAWGARDSIAVTAVLASQFALVAALIAHALGERISGRQWLGVATVVFGVTAITLSRL